MKFISRRKLLLSATIDKATERDLQIVVERGSEVLASKGGAKAEPIDFTSHPNMANQPAGHYVIYWEIKGEMQ
ncbi:hypothetical protein TIFTF001_026262 [Ficus carica]|uniref:GH3 C-terminal domain-containing protein n=1 Tax=Ficus carica TaxID=3494 RepID=A0AA88IWN0_FICCA|nr:hypothetical protein TIFTF001_026262 [Ficus carica]